jgi:hypothetical protein
MWLLGPIIYLQLICQQGVSIWRLAELQEGSTGMVCAIWNIKFYFLLKGLEIITGGSCRLQIRMTVPLSDVVGTLGVFLRERRLLRVSV